MVWDILLWIAGVALLIVGLFTMVISYRKEWIAKLRRDPSMVGLGLALVSIGFFFWIKLWVNEANLIF